MIEKLTLHNITVENQTKVIYDYSYTPGLKKFFNSGNKFFVEYEENIENTPISILIIPFLSNFAPISWLAEFEIQFDECDKDFITSLLKIKSFFSKNFSNINSRNNLIFNKSVENKILGNNSLMLFSGGVDTFGSFFNNIDTSPHIATIIGADVELTDYDQINRLKDFNENICSKFNLKSYFIYSNLRQFYTYHVDNLLDNGRWWGKVQHGLALISLLAPISFKYGYSPIIIAATRSKNNEFSFWGSLPQIDSQVSWANSKTYHDSFEKSRQDKIELIVTKTKQFNSSTNLRVCYSETNKGLNCSACEKCLRTIYGIMLTGENPNNYGFYADENVYNLIISSLRGGFSTAGSRFFWMELLSKSNLSNPYIFNNKNVELTFNSELKKVILINSAKPLKQINYKSIKSTLRYRFNYLYNIYLKIRRL